MPGPLYIMRTGIRKNRNAPTGKASSPSPAVTWPLRPRCAKWILWIIVATSEPLPYHEAILYTAVDAHNVMQCRLPAARTGGKPRAAAGPGGAPLVHEAAHGCDSI